MISRVFWVQCVLAVTVAAAAMPFGRAAVFSAFVGGINSLVPTVYFARKVLGTPAGAADKGVFGVWMRAEVAKIAIVCGLFIAAFVLLEGLDMTALFAGFIVVHVGGVLASLTLDPRRRLPPVGIEPLPAAESLPPAGDRSPPELNRSRPEPDRT